MNTPQATLAIGAAARLTRLVTRDTITEPLRRRVLFNHDQRRAIDMGEPVPPPSRPAVARARSWAYALVSCDWCAGFWVSGAVVMLAHTSHGATWYTLPASALTLSQTVGLLASAEERLTG